MDARKVAANDEIRRAQAELGVDAENERLPYLCECRDVECRTVILVATARYDAARADPAQRLVAAGHEGALPVVERGEGYTVVREEG
jgi:hypothetical protein